VVWGGEEPSENTTILPRKNKPPEGAGLPNDTIGYVQGKFFEKVTGDLRKPHDIPPEKTPRGSARQTYRKRGKSRGFLRVRTYHGGTKEETGNIALHAAWDRQLRNSPRTRIRDNQPGPPQISTGQGTSSSLSHRQRDIAISEKMGGAVLSHHLLGERKTNSLGLSALEKGALEGLTTSQFRTIKVETGRRKKMSRVPKRLRPGR